MKHSYYILLNLIFLTIYAEKFEWEAQNYQDNSLFQRDLALFALANITLCGNENILDVGCGDGYITKLMAEKVPLGMVKGIDISEDMLKYANNKYILDNLSFEEVSLEDFVTDKKYDLVIAFSVLSWIKNKITAIFSISAALKTGGKFVAIMANEDDPYLRARYAMFTHDKWKQFFYNYDIPYYPFNEHKIRELLYNAGFINIVVQKVTIPSLYVTKEIFIDMLRAIPAQKDMIPEEYHQDFFENIVEEYVKEISLNQEGLIELPFVEFFVTAEKGRIF